MKWLGGIPDSADMNLSKFCQMMKERGAWRAAVRGMPESGTTEQLNNSESAFNTFLHQRLLVKKSTPFKCPKRVKEITGRHIHVVL